MFKYRPQPLFAAKSFYFLYYGAGACLSPFLALYYRSLGFNGSQIGILASLAPLITLFAASIWSAAADASRRHQAVLLAAIAGTGLSVALLSVQRTFIGIIPSIVAFSFFAAPVIPLVDATVLVLLGERRDLYGRQRVWGAIGWGVAGPAAGWLVGIYGIRAIFPIYLLLIGLLFITGSLLKVEKNGSSSPFWRGMRELFSSRRWSLFLLIAFLSGTGLSIITNYLFLYMAELNATSAVMGLALTVSTISEIPVLFFSGALLRRWGPRGVLVLSLAAYVVRALGYSAATQPWQAVALQLLHGLSFSALWAAGVNFAGEVAPEGLGATAQGIFSSTLMGLGGISGAFLGGMLLDQVGGAGVFRVSAAIVFVGLLLLVIGGKSLQRH